MLFEKFKHKGLAIAVISSALILGACDQGGGAKDQTVETGVENALTPDDIYAEGAFRAERFGQVRWLADNTGFTQTEGSATLEGGDDLVQYDPNGANRKVLIAAELLVPADSEKPLSIADYAWSDDGSKALIFTNTTRVWRRNTRGDYWVLDLASGKLTQTGQQFEASTQMFAKFSPDGTKLAYVQRNGAVHNIYVEDVATNKVTQITKSGTDTVINGTFDWAYEEEFGLRDGFRWSPDSSKIAYWQLDSEGVKYFTLINNTDSLYPTLKTFPYPKVGETSSAARMGVVSAEGGATTWMQVPGDQRNNYVVFLEWAANSDEVVIQQLNRRQNTNNLYMASAADGTVKTVLTDTDEAWLNPVRDFMWLDGGNEFLWISEEGGWRQMYRISRDGKTKTNITPGAYDVVNIVRIDTTGGFVYFTASPEDPQRLYLYRVALDGSSASPEKLSPADQVGSHRYSVSNDGKNAIHWMSTRNSPEVIDLVSLPDHKRVKLFTDNAELKAKFDAIPKGELEFFQLETEDKVTLEGLIRFPVNFDKTKKYPVIIFTYGEPAGMSAADRWGRDLWTIMMSQKGYIMAIIDNRGQPAPKGREWRKSIYRTLGITNARDQAMGLKKLLADRPYMDGDRVGVWGHSGGGTTTLNLLFRYPDMYHVGVSRAPVPDIELYDNIYQERYSGVLPDDQEYYTAAKAITHAEGLKGKLLIMHGTGDDNVHYQGTERLINKLIELNKPFDFMSYPNRTHGIREGKNTVQHMNTKQMQYFLDHLPAGPR